MGGISNIFLKKQLRYIGQSIIYCCAIIYIISGISKLEDPTLILNTTELLLRKVFNVEWSLLPITIIVFFIIAWEILCGVLYVLNIHQQKVLWAFLITNLSFFSVSLYLKNIEKLETCGCMGAMSEIFHRIHFPFLYLFSFSIIVLIGINRFQKKRINKIMEN